MPTSNLALALEIINLVHTTKHDSVLDVGPGCGKYGVLLREYTGPIARLDAVEAWEPYVDAHRLRCIYDEVIVGDAINLPAERLALYDVVLMVDVLEHMDKDAGMAFLRRVPGKTIVCTPAVFFQNPEHRAIPPEKHRSLWTPEDFNALGADTCYVNIGGIIARL